MNKTLRTILILIAAAGLGVGGCDRSAKKSTTPNSNNTNAAKTSWTSEEIVKDPQGYLRWSDQQVVNNIQKYEKRVADLQKSREQFSQKQELLATNLEDVKNINKRMKQARDQANDNDDWPIRLAGRSFTAEKTTEIINSTQQYINEQNPLAERYDQFLDKVDSAIASTKKDISNLKNLREKIAMDMEQLKINQGSAEVDNLRTYESQISQMSTAITNMSDDPLKIPPPKEPEGKVLVDEMLK